MRDYVWRARFETLRQRESEGLLTAGERDELLAMYSEVEEEEASYLRPANEQLRIESLRLEAENRELSELVRREERLASRMERTLRLAEAEQRAIRQERDKILGRAGRESSTR